MSKSLWLNILRIPVFLFTVSKSLSLFKLYIENLGLINNKSSVSWSVFFLCTCHLAWVLVTLSEYQSPCLGTCPLVWILVPMSGYLSLCLIPVTLSEYLLSGYFSACLGTCHLVCVLATLSGYMSVCLGT